MMGLGTDLRGKRKDAYDGMTELQKAKFDMEYYRLANNWFGYKQAKRHYGKLLRKEKMNGR